ncbi:nitroreductase family deazaflavin-dependent oxidoreductase [Nocardia sp. NPDC003963]
MPAPRWIARANRAGLNKATGYLAPWAPGWAVVVHRGRKSGRVFRTPLWAFRRDGGYVIALTYGAESDWVQNVLTAGVCELETRRRRYLAGSPRIQHDETAAEMPPLIRFVLRRVIRAPDFLRVEVLRELDPAE